MGSFLTYFNLRHDVGEASGEPRVCLYRKDQELPFSMKFRGQLSEWAYKLYRQVTRDLTQTTDIQRLAELYQLWSKS